jgi:hypothetical protein
MTLSTVTFVAIRSSVLIVLTVLATIATIALSAVVGRREGLLAPS